MLYYQKGGYPKGYRLQKPQNQQRDRVERSFTEILNDGTTRGHYVGYDYQRPNGNWQGTSWVSAVKKAYRQYCTDFRQSYLEYMVRQHFNKLNDRNFDFKKSWKKLPQSDKLKYKLESAKTKCDPTVIHLRETTPGNNKTDFTFRERRYYLTSESIVPKKVTPSTGKSPRIYRFVPKVYPMKIDETLLEFKDRKNI